jgi:hypothetical protein
VNQARPSPWEPIRCPLPRCGADLYIVHETSTPLNRGDTVTDLTDLRNAVSATWRITCMEGHVLLLPDGAADSPTFGEIDPDEPDANTDVERLAELTGWEAGRAPESTP